MKKIPKLVLRENQMVGKNRKENVARILFGSCWRNALPGNEGLVSLLRGKGYRVLPVR